MSTQSQSKLNKLFQTWPAGTVGTQALFTKLEIDRNLAKRYARSGWIQRIGRGAYIRPGDEVAWPGAVYAAQTQLHLPVHVAAKTALLLQGYAHFLPLGRDHAVSLFCERGFWVPNWLKQDRWEVSIQLIVTEIFEKGVKEGFTEHVFDRFPIRVSSPERAILETLSLVPTDESYEEARLLFENLTTLRPAVLQVLLEGCRSIKAKRLFFFLAEKLGHAWLNEINPKMIGLGKGNRMIVRGGRFNSKYGITVPDTLTPEQPG